MASLTADVPLAPITYREEVIYLHHEKLPKMQFIDENRQIVN